MHRSLAALIILIGLFAPSTHTPLAGGTETHRYQR